MLAEPPRPSSPSAAVDTHYRRPEAWPNLFDKVRHSGWQVEALSPVAGEIVAVFSSLPVGLALATVGREDVAAVMALLDGASFLAKRHWRRPALEMIPSGLAKAKYCGLAFADADGRIVSYIDYSFRYDRQIEIGFCYSSPPYRGRGLIHQLIAMLALRHFDTDIDITTHEGNQAMNAAICDLGFIEQKRVAGERVNGEASIYYFREANTPISVLPIKPLPLR